jgi:hypothetical protein
VIRFEGWVPASDVGVGAVPQMSVWRGDVRLFVAGLYLADLMGGELLRELGGASDETRLKLEKAMCALEVSYIERRIRSGDVPEAPTSVVEQFLIREAELEELRLVLFGAKQCDYQDTERRDLYCVASSAADDGRIGTKHGHAAAATSPAICAACSLPDSRVLCAHLSHPDVRSFPGTAGPGRGVVEAFCGTGSPKIRVPHECRPAGNDCWARVVQIGDRQAPSVLVSPLDLAEALDFLDAVWRLVFKDGALVRTGTTVSASRLALPVTTREEFESNMSALADVLKRFDVPEALLPPAK